MKFPTSKVIDGSSYRLAFAIPEKNSSPYDDPRELRAIAETLEIVADADLPPNRRPALPPAEAARRERLIRGAVSATVLFCCAFLAVLVLPPYLQLRLIAQGQLFFQPVSSWQHGELAKRLQKEYAKSWLNICW